MITARFLLFGIWLLIVMDSSEARVSFQARLSGATAAEAARIAEQATRGVLISKSTSVSVADDVMAVFYEMKVRKAQAGEEEKRKRKKAVFFRLKEDEWRIIVDPGREILQGDVGSTIQDPFQQFIQMLPPKDCRYALYSAMYETKETKKEDLVFVFWAPENASIKSKMRYASSKDTIKSKFAGIKHVWQVSSLEDMKDWHALAEKLGGQSVVSLEGIPV